MKVAKDGRRGAGVFRLQQEGRQRTESDVLNLEKIIGMNFLATIKGRRFFFTVLYAAEGAPIGFIWWALPAYLRSHGVPLEHVTVTASVAALPWALKFLWAPLIDVLQTKQWTLRNWIIAAQFVMGCTLIPLLAGIESLSLAALAALIAVHAFSGATQDAAIDALCIKTVPEAERGSLNGWMQAALEDRSEI